MRRYENPLWQLIQQSPFGNNSMTFPKYFTRRRLGIEPFVWSVPGATSSTTAGANWNSDDNSQAKGKTQSSSGTHTSQTNGVTLTIQYQAANGEERAKIFKVTADEADDFISELNEGAPFPSLISKEQSVVFPADKIHEIRIEADVAEVGESKGAEASELGSGKAA